MLITVRTNVHTVKELLRVGRVPFWNVRLSSLITEVTIGLGCTYSLALSISQPNFPQAVVNVSKIMLIDKNIQMETFPLHGAPHSIHYTYKQMRQSYNHSNWSTAECF